MTRLRKANPNKPIAEIKTNAVAGNLRRTVTEVADAKPRPTEATSFLPNFFKQAVSRMESQ